MSRSGFNNPEEEGKEGRELQVEGRRKMVGEKVKRVGNYRGILKFRY